MYLLFSYFIVKRLSINDFGIFSYLLSLIVFCSNFVVLGMPTYLQKQVARNEPLDWRYFVALLVIIPVMAGVVYSYVIPASDQYLKKFVIVITLINGFSSIAVSVSNGKECYKRQYTMLLVSSLWMLLLLIYMLMSKITLPLSLLFKLWLTNAVVLFSYSVCILWSYRKDITLRFNHSENYQLIFINLLLIYAVSLPFEFSRVYDRFLLTRYFSPQLLGIYAFNCYIVYSVYALMIRPMATICVTALSKHAHNIQEQARVVCRYYLYILLIYLLIFLGYVPFAKEWLELIGLSKYIGSTGIFIFVFFNILIFNLSLPLVIKITLSDSHLKKLSYACLSLLLFNTSLLFIVIKANIYYFLAGLMVSYALHFVLCLLLCYPSSMQLFKYIGHEIVKLVKGGRAELLAFMAVTDE